MTERPILMTPENAQKCHDGTKTQTRRIVKVPDWVTDDSMLKLASQRPATGIAYYVDGAPVKRLTCPYGQVGDRLWVRESFYIDDFDFISGPLPKENPLLPDGMLIYGGAGTCCEQFSECDCGGKGAPWRPSIYMPRWACRTVLEITAVRVERLQDISQEDARAEGVHCETFTGEPYCTWCAGHDALCHRDLFSGLWESINGKGSWDRNDWVWVVSFIKVQEA